MKQPVAIIIARGGSKRLPRKNVLPFCGLPLVEWSIIQACCSHSLGPENTYLSTDDDEIAEIGEKHKINIIQREELENPDKITGGAVFVLALKKIRKTRDIKTFLDILPTAPLRYPYDFDNSILKYYKMRGKYPDCKIITRTVPLKDFVLYKYLDNTRVVKWVQNKKGYFALEGVHAFAQDVDLYIERFDDVLQKDAIIEGQDDHPDFWLDPRADDLIYFEDAELFQQFDIDTIEDFELCELLMEHYILRGQGANVYYDYRESWK